MDSEDVVIAEVQEEDPYEDQGDDRHRRIPVGPIVAVVLVVIILAGLGLYIFSPPSVNGVLILAPQDVSHLDDQRYGIELEMHVSSGMRSYDGTGALDMIHDGKVVHSRNVKINEDSGSTVIDYRDFVMENGIYDIRFSLEGKTATTYYIAKMVPDNLNISVQYMTNTDTGDVSVMAVVSPEFTYPVDPEDPGRIVIGDSIFYYSWNYELETTLDPPVGEPIMTKQSMWDYHRNRTYTKIWLPIEGEYMGYYTFSAKLVNNLVKEGSPYHELESDPEELVEYLNKEPELGDISAPNRVRVNQELTLTLRAADPDENGGISYYAIDWDYESTIDDNEDTVSDIQMIEIPEGDSSTVRVTHIYQTTGTYTISITVADNGYVDDEEPPVENYRQFDTTLLSMSVTLL
ncbi:MAG: hypothetical protein JXA22_09215 [Candidatus Thermoplasmatota archaeon]|nr:hypothetical protein [Candidatus Thermoplasmatota archaeon]